MSAFYAINEFKPDLVINAGTAGGFKRAGAEIGDAFISTLCAHHDRRIPIPGFTEYGKGDHSAVACPNLIKVSKAVSIFVVCSDMLFVCVLSFCKEYTMYCLLAVLFNFHQIEAADS